MRITNDNIKVKVVYDNGMKKEINPTDGRIFVGYNETVNTTLITYKTSIPTHIEKMKLIANDEVVFTDNNLYITDLNNPSDTKKKINSAVILNPIQKEKITKVLNNEDIESHDYYLVKE
ncbi:MAG: hypothetical protein ACOCRK_08785 [bacterium]